MYQCRHFGVSANAVLDTGRRYATVTLSGISDDARRGCRSGRSIDGRSRNARRADDREDDDASDLNIPRFLGRNNNRR